MPKKKNEATIHISPVCTGEVSFCLKGTSGFLHNRLPEKARHQLLLPQGSRRNSGTLKHDVEAEYRSSVYRSSDDASPTLIQMVGSAFRQAMQTAALELPGVSKSQVQRLIWVPEDRIDIFGRQQLHMSVVRQAGINRTPDIRTRAFMPEWAAVVPITFVEPQFTEQGVANLLAAAGIFVGVGDGRNEKGAFSYGLWELCSADDPDFLRICATQGRDAQIEAFNAFEGQIEGQEENLLEELVDSDETRDLYHWYIEARRHHKALRPNKRSNGADDAAIA